jgi:hypothetical protein
MTIATTTTNTTMTTAFRGSMTRRSRRHRRRTRIAHISTTTVTNAMPTTSMPIVAVPISDAMCGRSSRGGYDGGKRRDRDVEGERLLELASRQLRGGECDKFDECDE